MVDFVQLRRRLFLSIRKRLDRLGVGIVPMNVYSNIPSVAEIESSFEYQPHSTPPYLNKAIFDDDYMAHLLEVLTPYAAEFNPPTEGDQSQPDGYFWNNGQFSHTDALAYYAMIRHRKPTCIVEVGGGFSTYIAQAAIVKNGFGKVVCIEPYPRDFLKNMHHVELIEKPVQHIEPEQFNEWLSDGDILFIDSTHTVKIGSDCLYLYLKVIPSLAQRTLVHVHDIFLPDAMPRQWALEQQIYWTEQYLLLAYLLDNPKIKTWFSSHYHAHYNRERLKTFMNNKSGLGGGSFWFERSPN